MKTKNPVFLESIQLEGNKIEDGMLGETLTDYHDQILDFVIGLRSGMFECGLEHVTLKDAFEKITSWVDEFYTE